MTLSNAIKSSNVEMGYARTNGEECGRCHGLI